MKKSDQTSIYISITKQQLRLKRGRSVDRTYPVSTSKYGLGSEGGSLKTPLGRFRIAEKIGHDLPTTSAFQSRKVVDVSEEMLQAEDLVMSRILWLDGLEKHNANTFARYVYIHGTNHEELIGQPASHGCVRMRNRDVAELFDLVEVDTPVQIEAPKARQRRGRKGEKSVAPRVHHD
ncbi:MAG: L,D-transpeptidase [Verrucomicrobiota bacterium]|nr:L,D-transpeptidase [Verrucomicrobiota bacterium]